MINFIGQCSPFETGRCVLTVILKNIKVRVYVHHHIKQIYFINDAGLEFFKNTVFASNSMNHVLYESNPVFHSSHVALQQPLFLHCRLLLT